MQVYCFLFRYHTNIKGLVSCCSFQNLWSGSCNLLELHRVWDREGWPLAHTAAPMSGCDLGAAWPLSAVDPDQFGLQAGANSQTFWDTFWKRHIRNTAAGPSQYALLHWQSTQNNWGTNQLMTLLESPYTFFSISCPAESFCSALNWFDFFSCSVFSLSA